MISLILHLLILIAFRANLYQRVRGLESTYVHLVDIPPLPHLKESEEVRKKGDRGRKTENRREILRDRKGMIAREEEKKAGGEEMKRLVGGEGEKAKKSKEQRTEPEKERAIPPPYDSSAKGMGHPINGLPFLTDNDLERLAKLQGPAPSGKEKGITLNTDEFKYISYLQRLKNRIEFKWRYPEVASLNRLEGDLYIRFSILKNGRLGMADLIRSSGYRVLDEAALQALRDSDPFWPLPKDWDLEELIITGHFIYYLGGVYLKP